MPKPAMRSVSLSSVLTIALCAFAPSAAVADGDSAEPGLDAGVSAVDPDCDYSWGAIGNPSVVVNETLGCEVQVEIRCTGGTAFGEWSVNQSVAYCPAGTFVLAIPHTEELPGCNGVARGGGAAAAVVPALLALCARRTRSRRARGAGSAQA